MQGLDLRCQATEQTCQLCISAQALMSHKSAALERTSEEGQLQPLRDSAAGRITLGPCFQRKFSTDTSSIFEKEIKVLIAKDNSAWVSSNAENTRLWLAWPAPRNAYAWKDPCPFHFPACLGFEI